MTLSAITTTDATGPVLRRPPAMGIPRQPPVEDGCPGQLRLDLFRGVAPVPPPPDPDAGLPDPGRWAAQFVQAALEVAQGRRPPAQLSRWVDPAVLRVLQRRHRLAGPQHPPPPRVRVVRAEPGPGGVEVAAVAWDGDRVRAVALRLDRARDRWRVGALELG